MLGEIKEALHGLRATDIAAEEAMELLSNNAYVGELGVQNGVGHYGGSTLAPAAQEALIRLADIGVELAIELVGVLGL